MRCSIVVLTQVFAVLAVFAGRAQSENSTSTADEEPKHSKVLIIGAGASGVAAASRLMDRGVLDVTILEAEDRLGGRINTIPFGEDVVDLGAQWVHGAKDNVVYEMANPLGLLQENATAGLLENTRFVSVDGTLSQDQEFLFNLTDVTWGFREDSEGLRNYSGSFGEFTVNKYADYVTDPANNITATRDRNMLVWFLNWFEKLSAFSDGAESWFNISAKETDAYWECEGDQGISWINNGYYSVIDLLTKKFPDPTQELPVRNKTHFGTEVKTIRWGSKGPRRGAVEVETTNGERYTADFVVVTVSLGVLKEKAANMFDPPLNDRKLNAIQNIGFGQVNKIMMHFTDWWLPPNVTGFSFLVTEEDPHRFRIQYPEYSDKGEWLNGLTGFYAYPRQPRAVLYAWLVGESARNMEKYSENDVMAGCMRWMEMIFNKSLPWPASITRSQWFGNPHFRGSYSYQSLDSEHFNAQPSHLAEPLVSQEGTPEVLFAGEATSDHHFSTVHGAIETGWREANRILDILKKH